MNDMSMTIGGISRSRIAAVREREELVYSAARPISQAMIGDGAPGYLGGVPMHWMRDWPMPFPFVVKKAKDAKIVDVDGIKLADFCLGDTGSMFGHSPAPVVEAIRRQGKRGLTYMLPSDDALIVGELLVERFGLPYWQIATTATDANRFALRVARAVTNRPKILVFNGCYHGSVDETFVQIRRGWQVNKAGLAGEFRDLTRGAVVVEFNDIQAVEKALAEGDIACVITEPVMTNSCMVLPEPGFHEALRDVTRKHGTLLLIDETHTISTGPGGYTRAYGLEPDLFVLGKPIAGGVPASIWGMSEDIAARWQAYEAAKEPGYSGMGTTLSGNPLQFAAMRAVLEEVMTPNAYARMEDLADRLQQGLAKVIDDNGLAWHVVRVGARVEFVCAQGPLGNGTESAAAHAPELEAVIHLGLVNRGCLIAPFHNMMLVSPVTKKKHVDRLIMAFEDVISELAE